jgi:hypothetical protein
VREGLELAEARELPGVVAMGRLLEALLASARGAAPAELAERAVAAWEQGGQRHLLGVGRLVLASALEREGKYGRALAVLEEECGRASRRLSRFPIPELHRRRGEMLRRLGREQEAETALCLALRLARRGGAIASELGAATSLARLLVDRGAVGSATRTLDHALAGLAPSVDAEERVVAQALLAQLSAEAPPAPGRLLAAEAGAEGWYEPRRETHATARGNA